MYFRANLYSFVSFRRRIPEASIWVSSGLIAIFNQLM